MGGDVRSKAVFLFPSWKGERVAKVPEAWPAGQAVRTDSLSALLADTSLASFPVEPTHSQTVAAQDPRTEPQDAAKAPRLLSFLAAPDELWLRRKACKNEPAS
jgi:hypothetical protein